MSGETLKLIAMQQVMDAEPTEWKEQYISLVPTFLKSFAEFNNDDVSEFMLSKGMGPPHHSGVWGSMFSAHFAKSDFVVSTGKTVSARKTSSKARRQTLWRSTLCAAEGEVITMNQQLIALASKVRMRQIDLRQALKEAAQIGADSVY